MRAERRNRVGVDREGNISSSRIDLVMRVQNLGT